MLSRGKPLSLLPKLYSVLRLHLAAIVQLALVFSRKVHPLTTFYNVVLLGILR